MLQGNDDRKEQNKKGPACNDKGIIMDSLQDVFASLLCSSDKGGGMDDESRNTFFVAAVAIIPADFMEGGWAGHFSGLLEC